jgi:hypothetical protein
MSLNSIFIIVILNLKKKKKKKLKQILTNTNQSAKSATMHNNVDNSSHNNHSVSNSGDSDSHYNRDISGSGDGSDRDSHHIQEILAEDDLPPINIKIFRYKFTQEFMDHLYEFSKIHQYEHRSEFKESWVSWTIDNKDIIDEEVERLTSLQYIGDISEKMFKSARYYFRKKSTVKAEPKERRVYIKTINQELLESMDSHISKSLKTTRSFKPSDGFNQFCQEHSELIKEEIMKLLATDIDKEVIKDKIKKTYKNRYSQFRNN